MKQGTTIGSGSEFNRFLVDFTRQVVRRRIDMLLEGEEENQVALVGKLNDLDQGGTKDNLDEKDDEEADDDVKLDAPADEDEQIEEVDPQVIIEKLNVIRAGHSLKRSDIKEQMEAYIESLDDAEKIALNKFLKGIAAIITGAVDADSVDTPRPEVKMKTNLKIVDKPKVIKKRKDVDVAPSDKDPDFSDDSKDSKKKKKDSLEDTTPPIMVKHRS